MQSVIKNVTSGKGDDKKIVGQFRMQVPENEADLQTLIAEKGIAYVCSAYAYAHDLKSRTKFNAMDVTTIQYNAAMKYASTPDTPLDAGEFLQRATTSSPAAVVEWARDTLTAAGDDPDEILGGNGIVDMG